MLGTVLDKALLYLRPLLELNFFFFLLSTVSRCYLCSDSMSSRDENPFHINRLIQMAKEICLHTMINLDD